MLANGGSVVIPEQTGHLPGLTGWVNPILDNLDRMYLYATNVAIDEGRRQPVHFKLGDATDGRARRGMAGTVRRDDRELLRAGARAAASACAVTPRPLMSMRHCDAGLAQGLDICTDPSSLGISERPETDARDLDCRIGPSVPSKRSLIRASHRECQKDVLQLDRLAAHARVLALPCPGRNNKTRGLQSLRTTRPGIQDTVDPAHCIRSHSP